MQISDVRVRKNNGTGESSKVKATVSVVFDGMFVVHDMRVVEGINGVFVAMPRRKTAEGEFKDTAHPITAEAREMIQKAVLEAYLEMDRPQPTVTPAEVEEPEAVAEVQAESVTTTA
ncbi:MAG TPA: septation regulator SpoVG [Symbiobacteriaceae bacterium]|jgi:stage V sporulation protein G|nr:septation regulator SpoVG [Symbiobacteriaceae bacterium]